MLIPISTAGGVPGGPHAGKQAGWQAGMDRQAQVCVHAQVDTGMHACAGRPRHTSMCTHLDTSLDLGPQTLALFCSSRTLKGGWWVAMAGMLKPSCGA